jgi:molecular chaperone DnaK
MIERNTTIPTRKSQVYSTASDGQTQVEVHVVQGERPMAADNKSLGKFILDGIPAAPRGVPQIEVTFDIDANGILKVTALDKATSRSQHITITASSGLSETEVERMRREAEQHADEDLKRKELIEARNHADNMVYTTEKFIRENGEKLPADLKTQAEERVQQLKQAMEKDDAAAIRQATEDLNQVLQKLGASMYSAPGGQESPGAGPAGPDQGQGPQPGGPGGEDVVDGEFRNA